MNGCSKRKSSFLLNPYLTIQQKFPKIQYHQFQSILASQFRLTKLSAKSHPCLETWKGYLSCLRTQPSAGIPTRRMETDYKKCNVEATNHYQCLQNNNLWRPDADAKPAKLLESFRLWNPNARYKYPTSPMHLQASGVTVQLKHSQ